MEGRAEPEEERMVVDEVAACGGVVLVEFAEVFAEVVELGELLLPVDELELEAMLVPVGVGVEAGVEVPYESPCWVINKEISDSRDDISREMLDEPA